MKKYVICLLVFTLFITGCSQSSGNKATKSGDVRIVPTTVALTETLDALELDIVGKPDSYKTLPKRYDDVKKVGQPMEPDMELVKSVNPTHILGVSTIKEETEPKFKQLDAEAIFYDYDSLAGMKKSITEMGDTFDRKAQAKKLNQKFEDKESEIRLKVKGKKHPKVLILMGVPGSYHVATSKSYIGNLVEIAGGENVITDTSRSYVSSNSEALLDVNPDIILRLAHGMPDEVVKMFKKEFATNDTWKHFDAVKKKRVYDLEEIPFGITASIKADEAMEQLYNIFYNQ